MRATQADIKSWTENSSAKVKRPCRMFVVEVSRCMRAAGIDGIRGGVPVRAPSPAPAWE